MGIRVVVVDDNPHVRWEGRVYPVNATFHRFLAGFLDLPGQPITEIVHCVPLRDATAAPGTLPLDPRLRVVGTAPFDGIAGYLRHLLGLTRRNRATLAPEIRHADLVWLKVPASNGLLAGLLARAAGTPRFTWVAGSSAAVARGQRRNPFGWLAATLIGLSYDAVGYAAGVGGLRIVVGANLIEADGTPGRGVVASVVASSELADPSGHPWLSPGRLRLAWAGRVAAGKGLEALIESLRYETDAELIVVGDGPARTPLVELARRTGVADRITWLGHVADRTAYLAALMSADIFVFPSPAEGFPKAVLDAAAVGLPVLATQVGGLGSLIAADIIGGIDRPDAASVARAVRGLVADPERADRYRQRGFRFASEHTARAEATRLVDQLRSAYPELGWDASQVRADERTAGGRGDVR